MEVIIKCSDSCRGNTNVYGEPIKELVRCKDCRHADECNKRVQYARNEPNSVTIGYSQIEWCSRGERKGGDDE